MILGVLIFLAVIFGIGTLGTKNDKERQVYAILFIVLLVLALRVSGAI